MIYIVLNGLPILTATVTGLLAGLAYRALVAPQPARGRALLAVMFVAEFWLACILAGALILAPTQAGHWTMAIGSAVVIWIGFVVPVLAVTAAERPRPLVTGLRDAGYWFVVMLTQAVVMTAIGLAPPPG